MSLPSWPRWRPPKAERGATASPSVLPLDQFGRRSTSSPANAAVVLAAPEEVEPALRDLWEDATTSMQDEDARRLYVDVAGPLDERAALVPDRVGEDDEDAFRASRAE